jgi:hypothetical protein
MVGTNGALLRESHFVTKDLEKNLQLI